MNILLLISGYTCRREPWGQGDIGTPNIDELNLTNISKLDVNIGDYLMVDDELVLFFILTKRIPRKIENNFKYI